MTLDISPQIEAKLTEVAHQNGIEPGKLIEQLIEENYPSVARSNTPELSAKKRAMIAWLDERIAAAPTDPEGVREAQAELDELMENLNRNRVESGENPLLP